MDIKKYKRPVIITSVVIITTLIIWVLYKTLFFQFNISPSDRTMSNIGPSVTFNFNMKINTSTAKIEYDENIFHEIDISEKYIKLSTLNRETAAESTSIDIVFIETSNGTQTIEGKTIEIAIKDFNVNNLSSQEYKDLISNQDRKHEIDPIFKVLPEETLEYTIKAKMSADQPIVTIMILTSSIDDDNSIEQKRDEAMTFLKSLKESDGIDISKYYIRFEN